MIRSELVREKQIGLHMRKILSSEVYQEKRAKGLCFKCDENWNLGHHTPLLEKRAYSTFGYCKICLLNIGSLLVMETFLPFDHWNF